jgi:hypothetical protein
MNGGTPHDHAPDERLDNNDPLWRLLAQAPRLEPDAWFAARTMARCRNEGLAGEVRAFSRIWRWALGGGLAVMLAMALVMQNQVQTEKADKQQNVQEAFEIVASMNADSDPSSSPSSWQDSSL